MFAVMVTAAALFAAVSLMAVSKAPGGAPQPGDGQADEPGMNWGRFRAAWEIPEFRRVVRFAVWQTLSLGALGGFAINYAKEYLGTAGDGMVLLFSAGNLAAAMAAGWIAGRWLDRTGSRPVLRCSCWAFVAIALAWLACALGKARFGHGALVGREGLFGVLPRNG